MSKKVSLSSSGVTFPTISKFINNINELSSNMNLKKSTFSDQPLMPNYLKEYKLYGNPFTNVKVGLTVDLKKAEKKRKEFDKKRVQDFSVEKIVSRNTRINFGAKFELNHLKYMIGLGEIHEGKTSATSYPEPLISIPDSRSNEILIEEKRSLCKLNLAIKVVKDQILNLDKIIVKEEEFIRIQYENLQAETRDNQNYLKKVCQKTYKATKAVDCQLLEKDNLVNRLKREKFVASKLNAECIMLEETFNTYKWYKMFIRKCQIFQERKLNVESPSLKHNLKNDTIVLEREMVKMDSNDDNLSILYDVSSSSKKKKITLNNSAIDKYYINNSHDDELVEMDIKSKTDWLEKLKTTVFLGFDANINNESEHLDSFQSPDMIINKKSDGQITGKLKDFRNLTKQIMQSVPFQDPQELVNILCELEVNNLSLIENVQQQEELIYTMRYNTEIVKKEITDQMDFIEAVILHERNIIDDINETVLWLFECDLHLLHFNNIDRYRDIFYLNDLDIETLDELSDYFVGQIGTLYQTIFPNSESHNPDMISMLKRIESLVDLFYIKLLKHNKKDVIKAKKVIDTRKRQLLRSSKIRKKMESDAKRLKNAMEKSLLPPKYKLGRKVVYRSNPPKKLVQLEVINMDNLRQQEEYAYFFT